MDWHLAFLVYGGLTLLSFLFICVLWRSKPTARGDLPPSPSGWPLLGNMPDLIKAGSAKKLHILMQDWAKSYGEVYRVRVGPVEQYMLNSDRAVKHLMDRNSALSSARPRWIVAGELLANNWSVLFLSADNPRWKVHRRIINTHLASRQKADSMLTVLYQETLQWMHEVCHDTDRGSDKQNVWAGLQRYTYSTFARQMVGLPWPKPDHESMKYMHQSAELQILETFPLANLVDLLPWLQHLPLFLKPWERWARKIHADDLKWARTRTARVQQLMMDTVSQPDSLLAQSLRDERMIGFESLDEASIVAVQLIGAAADTSQMSTWSFLEAMMTFPDVQHRAQQKIDAVVGDRIPTWEDFDRIPYVRSLMKETWRWRPPVALGHAHVTTEEMEYSGYIIPKGARLHINAWAISHDPGRHEDPEEFRPERYEDDDTNSLQSANQADPSKRDHFAFGSGRRMCSGISIAERSLAVAIMRILWAFDVKPKPGVTLPAEFPGELPGVAGTSMPVMLVPRSAEKVRLIDAAFENGHTPSSNSIFTME